MMVNIGQENKDHKCKILTVKKWEKELSCKLEYDTDGSEVVSLRCRVCKKWEKSWIVGHDQDQNQLRRIH